MLRQLPNGDLYQPHRGEPQTCPDGYIRDTGDPYLYHPTLADCDKREERMNKGCCGKMTKKLFCTDLGFIVPGTCKQCQIDPEYLSCLVQKLKTLV